MSDYATKSDLTHEIDSVKSEIRVVADSLKGDIREVLEVINAYAQATEQRFEGLETRLTRVETRMVTKSYLDEKLWDLRGDMVSMMNRAIGKHETRFHAA